MAGDDPKIDIKPDVPKGSAIVPRTNDEAKKQAMILRGEMPPDRAHFYCVSCGKDKTLEFDKDELEVLDGDPRNYKGPCWNIDECGAMTLRPYDEVFDHTVSVSSQAAANKKKEYREQGEAFADALVDKALGVMAPKPPEAAPGAPQPPEEESRPPGQRDDLPDATDEALSDVKR